MATPNVRVGMATLGPDTIPVLAWQQALGVTTTRVVTAAILMVSVW